MKQVMEINEVDRQVYEDILRDFLPQRMIDIHSHVWLEKLKKNVKRDHVVNWCSLVARENPIADPFRQ